MIITPIDRLIQMIRDFFGNREDYKLPIKKNRLAFYIFASLVILAMLLIPIAWVFERYSSNGIKSARGMISVMGVVYLMFGYLLLKIPSKTKIKLRGWLGGKGNFWHW